MTPTRSSLNRSAIVTGAGQGLGRAIALRLAQDGYDVAVNDLASNSAALDAVAVEIRARGRKSIAVTGNVGQEDDVQTLVDRTVAELGELYVMVANAGVGQPPAAVVDLNLTGVFLCYRAAARQMLKQGRGGRIVGAGSAFGKRGHPGAPAYSATKFGVRGLTQSMASELAKDGITVNAYAPGFIDTPLVWESDKLTTAAAGTPPGSWAQSMKDSAPMGRFGTPEDVGGLISYIVSDEANFMTGQTVSLNGGLFYD